MAKCYVLLLATVPYPYQKRFLQRMQSTASSSNLHYIRVSLRSYSSCLRLLLFLSRYLLSFLLPSILSFLQYPVLERGSTQYVNNTVILPVFYSMYDVPFVLNSKKSFFIFYTISLTDFPHPSLFMIHFLKCPSFSTTHSNVAIHQFLP